MVAAIKQVVTVQPGGLIEIRSNQLREGTQAEVIVLVEEQATPQKWADFIGSGKGCFSSVEEVDAYINEIRVWGDRDK